MSLSRLPHSTLRSSIAATLLMLCASLARGETLRVSVSSTGEEADGGSTASVISLDGRFVAFQSEATNLVADDGNGEPDVFVHDLETRTTERVSVSNPGEEADGASFAPSISADGRYVAFHSDATNLVAGETSLARHVYVRDRLTGTTRRVSGDAISGPGDLEGQHPSISGDGRFVCFLSRSTTLSSDDDPLVVDVFVRDLATGAIELASRTTNGEAADQGSFECQLSGDGREVLFTSVATNLDPLDDDFRTDVFIRDRAAGTTSLISDVAIDGTPVDEAAIGTVSHDGAIAAFVAGGLGFGRGLWVRELESGPPVLLEPPGLETATLAPLRVWALSADGRLLAVETAYPLVATDTDGGAPDLYLLDRLSGAAVQINVSDEEVPSAASGSFVSLARDGDVAAFASGASDLVSGDQNSAVDVFVRRDATLNACTTDESRLCLAGNRFAVSATWATPDSEPVAARAVQLTADAGYFWFFDEANVELVVKLLDACSLGTAPGFWFFAAGLTDVAVEITLLDAVTGAEQRYGNGGGSGFRSVIDLGAFTDCTTEGSVASRRQSVLGSAAPAATLGSPVPGSLGFGRLVVVEGETMVVAGEREVVAHVFSRQADGSWLRIQTIENNGEVAGAAALALDQGVLAVGGANRSDGCQVQCQVVAIYRRTESGLFERVALVSDPEASSHPVFGARVALSGNWLAVVADRRSFFPDPRSGVVYLFERTSGETWTWRQRLLSPPGDEVSDFGEGLALEGDILVVGTGEAKISCVEQGFLCSDGVAYSYRRVGEEAAPWLLETVLQPESPDPSGYFGTALAMDAGLLAVGAPHALVEGRSIGAVHLFERDATANSWRELPRVVDESVEDGARFGVPLVLEDGRLATSALGPFAVGAPRTFLFRDSPAGFFPLTSFAPGQEGSPSFGRALGVSGGILAIGDSFAVDSQDPDSRGVIHVHELGACSDEDTAACVNRSRFRVEVDWSDGEGATGAARASRLSSDTAVFTFFDQANVELVVKVLDACGLPGFGTYWVYAAGLTSLEVELRIIDSVSGAVRTYQNPQGRVFETIRDTAAFPCP